MCRQGPRVKTTNRVGIMHGAPREARRRRAKWSHSRMTRILWLGTRAPRRPSPARLTPSNASDGIRWATWRGGACALRLWHRSTGNGPDNLQSPARVGKVWPTWAAQPLRQCRASPSRRLLWAADVTLAARLLSQEFTPFLRLVGSSSMP